jgi:hypothetical protein
MPDNPLDVSLLIDLTAQIDYTSLDWVSLLTDMVTIAPIVLPEWTDFTPSDFGVVMLELFAAMMDNVAYRLDVIANESHMQTATWRKSVDRLAKLIDYTPAPAVSALADVIFTVDPETFERTIPIRTRVSTQATATEAAVVFETYEDITVPASAVSVSGSVVHGTSIDPPTVLGSSTGQPFQSFGIEQSPLSFFPDGTSSLEIYVDEGAGAELWTSVDNLLNSLPADKHYEVDIDENNAVTILFGDGRNGKIPASGTDNVTARARIGAGVIGNVGAGTIKTLVSNISWISAVTNANSASGGKDRESIESIKALAPRTLRTAWRAVTAEDYKTLTEGLPGVARAMPVCDSQEGGNFFNHVRLHIAPEGGGLPSQALKDAVTAFIREREVLTVVTTVEDPVYVACTVDAEVWLLPSVLRSTMQTLIDDMVSAFFDFESMDFDKDARLWDFIHALDGIHGVDYGQLNIFSRTGSGVGNILANTFEILQLGTYTLTLHGGIE